MPIPSGDDEPDGTNEARSARVGTAVRTPTCGDGGRNAGTHVDDPPPLLDSGAGVTAILVAVAAGCGSS